MGYYGLKSGDTIKCHSYKEMHEILMTLRSLGIYSDYLYEKDGKEGMWIIIEPVH